MGKLLRIEESDFDELEQIVPQLAEALMPVLNNRLRVQLRRCKTILSNVRWEYGPAVQVGIIPAGDGPPGETTQSF
jgi:hypothetical protein